MVINMKKIVKSKILAVISATVMASSAVVVGVSASTFHTNDKWDAGCEIGLGFTNFNYVKQYSNFYCPIDQHYSSVLMRRKGAKDYDRFAAGAKLGKWANSNSGWYDKDSNLDTRRSYYDHEHI